MSPLRVVDILKRAVEFHQMLVDFYSGLEKISENENVKLLVNYMARHENVLKDLLSHLTKEQIKQISDQMIKYEPEFPTCRTFENIKIGKYSNVDDVIEAGLTLNQCLINLYHHMVEVAPTEAVKSLFSNLETMEVAEKKRLARMKGVL